MDITFLMLHKNIKMVFIGMKVCAICGISKELSDFNNQKLGKFGKRSYCRLCQSEMKKKYNKDNREKLSEYQRVYRELNPLYNSEYQKNRRLVDINYRIMGNMRARLCNIIQNKTKNTFDCLGLEIKEFKQYIESKFFDGMSWDNYGEWQLDHIVPISNGKNENEICELNYYTNLRPLWKHENLIKSNKMLIKN